jgi:hypothetical protein
MGEEVMMEKDFPCPCGKGVLRIEVLEHDTWSSGRHSRWSLRCEDCGQKYRELFMEGALALREISDQIEQRRRALHDRGRAVGDKAAERYLPQFRDHVKSLKFKTAMHDAIGGHSSIQKFRDQTRFGDGLDQAIKHGLKERPAHALKQIGVEDLEIAAELAAIAEEKIALKEFIKEVPKYPIPNIDTQWNRD